MNEDSGFHEFLILGLTFKGSNQDSAPRLPIPHLLNDDEGVSYSLVLTIRNDGGQAENDYMIVISSSSPVPYRVGLHHAHAIRALGPILTLCRHVDLDFYSVLPISGSAHAELTPPWSVTQLMAACRSEIAYFFGGSHWFDHHFRSYEQRRLNWFDAAAPCLKRYIADTKFQRACSYLYMSISGFPIDTCDWRRYGYDPSFYRYASVSESESSFLNAYKAIESLFADPGKNRTRQKFVERLTVAGVDPNEPAGYGEQEPVIEKVLKYYKMRDEIAAHGLGRYKRDLKLSEILDLQALAQHLLLTVCDQE